MLPQNTSQHKRKNLSLRGGEADEAIPTQCQQLCILFKPHVKLHRVRKQVPDPSVFFSLTDVKQWPAGSRGAEPWRVTRDVPPYFGTENSHLGNPPAVRSTLGIPYWHLFQTTPVNPTIKYSHKKTEVNTFRSFQIAYSAARNSTCRRAIFTPATITSILSPIRQVRFVPTITICFSL